MTLQQKLAEYLRARKPAAGAGADLVPLEYVVIFRPTATFQWTLLDGKTGMPRPLVFARSQIDLGNFTASTSSVACQVVMTPEDGHPTQCSVLVSSFSDNVDADAATFFFCDGATSGDTFVYQKTDGGQIDMIFNVFKGANNANTFHATITDNNEHSVTIQIPNL